MQIVRAKRVKLSMDLAPLIDVVFQLLIFFMLTASFATPMMTLDLPTAKNKEEKNPSVLTVSIDKSGIVSIDNQVIDREELQGVIAQRLLKQDTQAISIRADKQMPYEHFVEVMDIARQAGALKINIVHRND